MSREVAAASMPSGLRLLIKKKRLNEAGQADCGQGRPGTVQRTGQSSRRATKANRKDAEREPCRLAKWQHVQQKNWGISGISVGNDGNSGELHAFKLSERLTPAQPTTPYAAQTRVQPSSLPSSASTRSRGLIKNSKYVSNLICAFISLYACVCSQSSTDCRQRAKGMQAGSHLIFPLWSLNMYKPGVGYVSVPTLSLWVCVCIIFD